MATIPATTSKAGRAGDRVHRPRRHLAGNERRRRQADRASRLRRPRPDPARRSGGGPARDRHALPRRMPRPRHRHGIGHDAAGSGQQERRRGDHGGGRVPDGASGHSARTRFASASRRTKKSGNGTKYFDVGRFGARYAYTMDGGPRGELEFESFSADAITITFRGFNTHPGYAKGRMVNAIKLAARFIERLPGDRCRRKPPTAAKDSCIRTSSMPRVDRTSVKLLIRDFDTRGLAAKEAVAARPGRGRRRATCRARRSRSQSKSRIATCAR